MISDRRFWQDILLALLLLATLPLSAKSTKSEAQSLPRVSDQDIVEGYNYYLGRLLVLRQQQLDFSKEGMKWNKIVHRAPGAVEWANPNLDVAYSEAWIALDPKSCTIVEVPAITGRYYTIQTLNGWGETTSNINERTYPLHPHGKFAYCLKEASVNLLTGTERINLPSAQSRLLARFELGKNPAEAAKLQKQVTLSPTGKPKPDLAPKIADFTNDHLPGVEDFTNAQAILTSDGDINEGMAPHQAQVMDIARAIRDPAERHRIDDVIHQKAIPEFYRFMATLGTKPGNGWFRPAEIGNYGSDYRTRTAVNFAGIWANSNKEVVYYKTNMDGQNHELNGSDIYTMTFPKSELPQNLAQYFWSATVVDSQTFRVIPNMLKRYVLSSHSPVVYGKDGSLTLLFANRLPINMPESNWIPTPLGENYFLTFRFYGPNDKVANGTYFPPPLVKQTSTMAQQALR